MAKSTWALGAATVCLALPGLQAQAQVGQPLIQPQGPQFSVPMTPLPELKRVLAQDNEPCPLPANGQSRTIFNAAGAGYRSASGAGQSMDIFGGVTTLHLYGDRLEEVTDFTLVLADGRRFPPVSKTTACNDSRAAPTRGIRLTFNLPEVSAKTTGRLELMAFAPEPIIQMPSLPTQPKICMDRATGRQVDCPTLIAPRQKVTLKAPGVVVFPRPFMEGISPETIDSRTADQTCRAQVTATGRNLDKGTITNDAPKNSRYRFDVVSTGSTRMTYDFYVGCNENTGYIWTMFSMSVPMRRGEDGAVGNTRECDTCGDTALSSPRLGGGAIGTRHVN